jgi:hypothetical protein
MDYFCGLSGSDCCAQHLEKAVHRLRHHEGILGLSGNFNCAESARHWLPTDQKIVFSNSFIFFHKNVGIFRRTQIWKISGKWELQNINSF